MSYDEWMGVIDGAAAHAMRMMIRLDAICSVALSHDEACGCDVCKAASGDQGAFGRVSQMMDEQGPA